jgi:hypothetical protein
LGGQIIERLTERAKLKNYKNEDDVKRKNGKVICEQNLSKNWKENDYTKILDNSDA